MHATIWAPPGNFVVDTPSAVAVDMGCRYTLEVDERGAGRLRVEAGWVGFEHRGLQSLVPAGRRSARRAPGIGPGTPSFETAVPGLRRGARGDRLRPGRRRRGGQRSTACSAEARARDALSLWHLLTRVEGEDRARVFDRLAGLVPAPAGVTRDGVLAGERAMRERWWDALGLGSSEFWRMWTGAWSDPRPPGLSSADPPRRRRLTRRREARYRPHRPAEAPKERPRTCPST